MLNWVKQGRLFSKVRRPYALVQNRRVEQQVVSHKHSAALTPGLAFRPSTMRDILLVGAGHTHLLVLQQLIENPITNARITLVSNAPSLWYSGMLPQVVSGQKQPSDIRINAARLAKLASARLVVEAVTGIDVEAKTLCFSSRPPMPFDVVSLNLGAVSALPPIIEDKNNAQAVPLLLPVKPLGDFLAAWQKLKAYLDAHKKRMEIAIVGGGVASIELALAIRAYQRAWRPSMLLHIHLVTRSNCVGAELPHLARESLRLELLLAHITVHHEFTATHLGPGGLFGETGTRLPVDAVVWATQVQAPEWCKTAGLTCDAQGFVSVSPTLQSISHPDIFVVGDLADFTQKPLPKAGVYAVRHAKVLVENLRRLAQAPIAAQHGTEFQDTEFKGTEHKRTEHKEVDRVKVPMFDSFKPQRDFLKILNLGNKKGLLCRNGFVYTGRLALRWKHRLDNDFLNGLAHPHVEIREPEAAVLRASVEAGQVSPIHSVSMTPLIWGDLFRLGRHATLWSLSRILGQAIVPHTLRACLTLPVLESPLAAHDVQLVTQGIGKVLEDEALNPNGVVLAGMTVRQGEHCMLEMRLEGAPVGEGVANPVLNLNNTEYSAICTHPLGAGYWGHAALAGALCSTAWSAMTEACFQRVANWWQVIKELIAQQRICAVRLIEADGVVPAIQKMIADDTWRLAVEETQLSILPDLVDDAVAPAMKTLYQSHPAVADNFWRLQRDFDIQPAVSDLSEWSKPYRALMDANVGITWVLLVRPDQREAVLAELRAANLPNAFCLGDLNNVLNKALSNDGDSERGLPEGVQRSQRLILTLKP